MNVSKLSKVELNRAMIWLYPHLNSFIWTDTGAEVWVGPKTLTNPHWSYLLNWNLTMPLAVENRLIIDFNTKEASSIGHYPYAKNKNPLRPICEVLVMIALDKKHG